MREKFSKRIQTIIKKSREEAVRMGHSYVGSEHLLLGLLSEKSGFSNKNYPLPTSVQSNCISVQILRVNFIISSVASLKVYCLSSVKSILKKYSSDNKFTNKSILKINSMVTFVFFIYVFLFFSMVRFML